MYIPDSSSSEDVSVSSSESGGERSSADETGE